MHTQFTTSIYRSDHRLMSQVVLEPHKVQCSLFWHLYHCTVENRCTQTRPEISLNKLIINYVYASLPQIHHGILYNLHLLLLSLHSLVSSLSFFPFLSSLGPSINRLRSAGKRFIKPTQCLQRLRCTDVFLLDSVLQHLGEITGCRKSPGIRKGKISAKHTPCLQDRIQLLHFRVSEQFVTQFAISSVFTQSYREDQTVQLMEFLIRHV